MPKKRQAFAAPKNSQKPAKPPAQDVENYNVLYTKHVKQNNKKWEEGIICYNNQSGRLCLFSMTSRTKSMEQSFPNPKPDFSDDSEFRMVNFLVQVVDRRDEGQKGGRMACQKEVRIENQRIASKQRAIQKRIEKGERVEEAEEFPEFKKGQKTGKISAEKSAVSSPSKSPMKKISPSQKGLGGGFPAKGRKKFVCPTKKREDFEDLIKGDRGKDDSEEPTPPPKKPDLYNNQLVQKKKESEMRAALFGNVIDESPSEKESEDSITAYLRQRRDQMQHERSDKREEIKFSSTPSSQGDVRQKFKFAKPKNQSAEPKPEVLPPAERIQPQVSMNQSAEVKAPSNLVSFDTSKFNLPQASRPVPEDQNLLTATPPPSLPLPQQSSCSSSSEPKQAGNLFMGLSDSNSSANQKPPQQRPQPPAEDPPAVDSKGSFGPRKDFFADPFGDKFKNDFSSEGSVDEEEEAVEAPPRQQPSKPVKMSFQERLMQQLGKKPELPEQTSAPTPPPVNAIQPEEDSKQIDFSKIKALGNPLQGAEPKKPIELPPSEAPRPPEKPLMKAIPGAAQASAAAPAIGLVLNQKLSIFSRPRAEGEEGDPEVLDKLKVNQIAESMDAGFLTDLIKAKPTTVGIQETPAEPGYSQEPTPRKELGPEKEGAIFDPERLSDYSQHSEEEMNETTKDTTAKDQTEVPEESKLKSGASFADKVKLAMGVEEAEKQRENLNQNITHRISEVAQLRGMSSSKALQSLPDLIAQLPEDKRQRLEEFYNKRSSGDESKIDYELEEIYKIIQATPEGGGLPEEELVTEDMVRKAEKAERKAEAKKRRLEDILARKKEEEEEDPGDYLNYGKRKKKGALEQKIEQQAKLSKINEEHEKKVADHNIRIKRFEEMCCDFSIRHSIYDMPREFVFRNRECYAAYFILAVVEMLKYAVKEDYNSQRTEVKLISIALEYIRGEKKGKKLPSTMAPNSKKKKRMDALKRKQLNQKYEDSSEESNPEEEEPEDLLNRDLFDDEVGSFYLRFKEGLPGLVRKDLMVDDLWILMKQPLVSNQDLGQLTDIVLAKSAWHYNSKQTKMKVTIIGKRDDLRFQAPQYKYAIKSVNLSGYQTLIDNLIEFRALKNPYVDSILNIANSKSKFKIIKECDPQVVEQTRIGVCSEFKLNMDQEIVLNEVTKWFLPREQKASQEKDESLIEGLSSQEEEDESKIDFSTFNHHNTNIILVHGAFGCGKSYLLVSIIRFICHVLDFEQDTETKILVCALTNVAVDRILQNLVEQGFQDIGRVGNMKKIHKSLLKYTFSSSSNKKQSDKETLKELNAMEDEIKAQYYNCRNIPASALQELDNIRTARNEIQEKKMSDRINKLTSRRVIGATCASTGFEIMKNMQFKIVILDECSQMLEPQSLLPISKFNCRKLLAVGDPLQLPPIISFNFKERRLQQQQILDASKSKGKSKRMQPHLPLFVRLQTEGQPSIILRTQYRCHPIIANVANYLFYESTLYNGVDEITRKRLLKQFPPYTFISADRGQEQKKDFSFVNPYEASFIQALVDYIGQLIYRKYTGREILYDSSDNEDYPDASLADERDGADYSIGVILTYRAQVEAVKALFEASDKPVYKSILVSTVDAFQGAERDIIILGCVRTRNLGFTEDCRRLNVAITRARRHLIVIGKESLLSRNNNWRYIIDLAKNKKQKEYGYRTVDYFLKKGGNFKACMKDVSNY